MAHHLQRLTRTAQIVWHRVAWEENLLDAFCQTDNRHSILNPQPAQHLVCTRKLTLTAIDNNQIGQLRTLLQQSGVAAIDNLAHRRKIIRTNDCLYIEMSVLLA